MKDVEGMFDMGRCLVKVWQEHERLFMEIRVEGPGHPSVKEITQARSQYIPEGVVMAQVWEPELPPTGYVVLQEVYYRQTVVAQPDTPAAPAPEPGEQPPVGTIIRWGGTLDEIPAGWAVCDGHNGTPNLKKHEPLTYPKIMRLL